MIISDVMNRFYLLSTLLVVLLADLPSEAHADVIYQWQVGQPGRGWPIDGVGGGPEADFVQEAGTNPLPGDPNSPSANQQADDDYYFAGTYPAPIGTVANDEIAVERAFAGVDNTLRFHFNLPTTLLPTDLASFTFEPINLDGNGADPRYGVVVTFNGQPILNEVVVRSSDLNTLITSPSVSLGAVGAQFGPGGDNVIELTGINYNAEGGGNWMGMDYHSLSVESTAIPEPSAAFFLTLAAAVITIPALIRRKRDAS